MRKLVNYTQSMMSGHSSEPMAVMHYLGWNNTLWRMKDVNWKEISKCTLNNRKSMKNRQTGSFKVQQNNWELENAFS